MTEEKKDALTTWVHTLAVAVGVFLIAIPMLVVGLILGTAWAALKDGFTVATKFWLED